MIKGSQRKNESDQKWGKKGKSSNKYEPNRSSDEIYSCSSSRSKTHQGRRRRIRKMAVKINFSFLSRRFKIIYLGFSRNSVQQLLSRRPLHLFFPPFFPSINVILFDVPAENFYCCHLDAFRRKYFHFNFVPLKIIFFSDYEENRKVCDIQILTWFQKTE